MSLNAYVPQENGNLKHLAEADASPDQVAEFIEVVQEEYPRQKDGPFVVMDLDSGFVTYVEFEDEEVVEVKRILKIGGVAVSNGDSAEPAPTKRRAKPGPKPGSTRKTTATKRTVKKAPAKAAASKTIKRSGSGFKRNPGSAE